MNVLRMHKPDFFLKGLGTGLRLDHNAVCIKNWIQSRSLGSKIQTRTYYGNSLNSINDSATTHANVYDLRSDTVTKPCEGMRQAIATASVGDNVFEDDFVVTALEERVAAMCGMEAALFCASGTMTNQLAMRVHTGALESVVCDARAHIFHYEGGGLAYHSQAQFLPVSPKDGHFHLTADAIEGGIFEEDIHCPTTTLIALENTLQGSVMPLENIREIKQLANERGLIVHMDGARLWNASVASGVPLSEYCKNVDSVSLCLSKTLGAPIGSILVGTDKVVQRAKKFRKMFGGGWRQAGLLAAAGMYAIDNNWGATMEACFKRSKALGEGLRKHGILVNTQFDGKIETNLLWTDFAPFLNENGVTLSEIGAALEKKGIIIFTGRRGAITETRLVMHHQITQQAIDEILNTVQSFTINK
eukprot:CFRG7941T1